MTRIVKIPDNPVARGRSKVLHKKSVYRIVHSPAGRKRLW